MALEDFKPLQGICEYLNALHVYTDEARKGVTRTVPATHFCAHVRKDLRQCLIYDSAQSDARLIGVEYMVPKEVYEGFPPEEQRLWHSHEFEVKSGMLVMPKPSDKNPDEWEHMETEAMKEVIGLYGKTWHLWQVDAGHAYPFGPAKLMGSLTSSSQADLDAELKSRDHAQQINYREKARKREGIQGPGVHENADSWWNPEKAK